MAVEYADGHLPRSLGDWRTRLLGNEDFPGVGGRGAGFRLNPFRSRSG
jgi:hypothetical protein